MKKSKVVEPQVKTFKLSTGYEITAEPVNSMLVYDAQEQFKYPEPPKIEIKQGGSRFWVDNTTDATYQERFEGITRQRNMAALSCIIQNGIHLVGEPPADDKWLKKVRRLIDLSLYEDDNGDITGAEREYLFLRYVAIATGDDYQVVFNAATLTEEAVQEEMAKFPGDEEGD